MNTSSIFKSFLFSSALLGAVGAWADRGLYESAGQKFRVEKLGSSDDAVWGFDFLPDGRIIFTGRDEGTVSILNPKNGQTTPLTGVPKVDHPSQGGMLDIRVSPEGGANPKIYLAFTAEDEKGLVGTVMGLATLEGNALKNYTQLFRVDPGVSSGNQFGARIEFDLKGHVFMTIGDHGHRDMAQQLDTNIGKVIRLNMDGSIPADNPYVNTPQAKKEIWSLGHRSPEGLTRHPVTGEIWEAEMGPLGGDEVNLIKKGANYGWPVITWGLEYSGAPVGKGLHEKEGMEQPIVYWIDTEKEDHISPAAITFYNGDIFPNWKGNAFVGTLSSTHVRRLVFDANNKVIEQEILLDDMGSRFRNVRSGPDGFIYYSTDDGAIGRLVPTK